MKLSTALNRQRDAVARLSSLFSVAPISGMTSADMNQEFARILEQTGPGAPRWLQSYLLGRRDAMVDSLYRDSLMYGGWIDGVFYSTHRKRADYYGKHGISPAEYAEAGRVTERGHYWTTTDTPRAFFV